MKTLLTYHQAVELTQLPNSPFYESKLVVDGYNVSMFNYRLADWHDFDNPLPGIKSHEMRGLTFVFDENGNIKRYLLLTKFFNLNQTPESLYSRVKNFTIKDVQLKEDGSIVSFIKLPNGKVVGKTKMGFTNDQADSINRIYNTNSKLKEFVDWSLENDLVAIFEYVSPVNRIVVKYKKEDLVLIKLRNNVTGEYIDFHKYQFQFPDINFVKQIDFNLDQLIELSKTEEDIEGWIVHSIDDLGNDQFYKIKTDWYNSLHGLLTEDIYRENVLISHILDDKIDDVLAQIPEDDLDSRNRINKIIDIVKYSISTKLDEIMSAYEWYLNSGLTRKDYALKYKSTPDFVFVMNMVKGDNLKKMSKEEILSIYDNMEEYEGAVLRCQPYEMSKEWIRDNTKRLKMARDWLSKSGFSLTFVEFGKED